MLLLTAIVVLGMVWAAGLVLAFGLCKAAAADATESPREILEKAA